MNYRMLKNVTVMVLGTRFKAINCIGDPGPQGHLFETPFISLKALVLPPMTCCWLLMDVPVLNLM
jgi:hypothetical protein